MVHLSGYLCQVKEVLNTSEKNVLFVYWPEGPNSHQLLPDEQDDALAATELTVRRKFSSASPSKRLFGAVKTSVADIIRARSAFVS